jgi:hypothetical protein
MQQQPSLNCGKCSTSTPLQWMYIPNETDVLSCGCCGTQYIVHKCQHESDPILLELVGYGVHYAISKACPQCEAFYKIGELIERVNPILGKEVKQLALGVGLVVLAFSAISYLNKRR